LAPIVKQALTLVLIVFVFGLAWTVAAQKCTGREVSVSTLKQQLLDLGLKETRIRIRLEELNEQLEHPRISLSYAVLCI